MQSDEGWRKGGNLGNFQISGSKDLVIPFIKVLKIKAEEVLRE